MSRSAHPTTLILCGSVRDGSKCWSWINNIHCNLISEKNVMVFGTRMEHTYNWGEPERAPHRRVERSQSIYYVWYVCHSRAAIDNTLACATYSMCAIYSDWPHENICATPLPRALSPFCHSAQARVSSCTLI